MRFFYQEDLNDCGLACLSMVIHHYHQQYVSPYQLKKLLVNNIEGGISFYELINLASKFNLKALAYSCELEFLKTQNKFPILVNIKDKNNLNHFVLLTELNDQKINILDPAFKSGHRVFTWNDFKEFYLGQIIVFEKIKKWEPKTNWKLIFSYVKKFWFWIFIITLATIANQYFWFLTNFFIRELEKWMVNNKIELLILIKFGGYFILGTIFYLLQLFCSHHLKQLLWLHLINQELEDLNIKFNHLDMQNGFWEKINNHHQIINSFFIFITKLISYFTLLPLIVLFIVKTNYFIIFIYLFFISLNIIFNNFYIKNYCRQQEEVDWKKTKYYNQLAFYLTNFNNFKKRQIDKINLELLNKEQKAYFNAEDKQNIWFFLIDTHQQLIHRIFSLTFWFFIFLFIFKTTKIVNDLLILSLISQLSMIWSIDLVQNGFLFWYQKNHLHNLKFFIETPKIEEKYELKEKDNIIEFKDFGFETPGSFQLLNSSFHLPLQILGTKTILNHFYHSCLSANSDLLINNEPISKYKHQIFAIDEEAIPVAPMVASNIFLGKNINYEIVNLISIESWLSKYNLKLNQSIDLLTMNKAQLQIINFFSLLLSDYQLYFINQPLTEINDEDQKMLWELLFKLKNNSQLIILGDINCEKEFSVKQMKI